MSHITWKSVTPRLPLTSLKNGSTILRKFALVNSSLNSNNCALAAVEIAFSSAMNNLRTLILSNADGLLSRVLSPNNIIPCPGKETNGFTLPLYNVSLSALLGLYANLVTPNSCPRFTPAGENHASATFEALAHKPATCPAAPIYLYTSLYLSYTYNAELSQDA